MVSRRVRRRVCKRDLPVRVLVQITTYPGMLKPIDWGRRIRGGRRPFLFYSTYELRDEMFLQLIPGLSLMYKTTSPSRVPSNELN